MPKVPITRYVVEELIAAQKVAARTKRNTLQSPNPEHGELALKIDVRRVDSRSVDLVLEFYGRVKKKPLPGVAPTQYPSASLLWQGKRIRGVDYSIKHDVVKRGIIVGSIKGWHEHFWTDEDEDNSIRALSPALKNFDLQAVIAWCAKKWNIEGMDQTTMRLL